MPPDWIQTGQFQLGDMQCMVVEPLLPHLGGRFVSKPGDWNLDA